MRCAMSRFFSLFRYVVHAWTLLLLATQAEANGHHKSSSTVEGGETQKKKTSLSSSSHSNDRLFCSALCSFARSFLLLLTLSFGRGNIADLEETVRVNQAQILNFTGFF